MGPVAQAATSVIKAPAKISRRQCCSFMADILPRGILFRQEQTAAVETACPQAMRYVGVPAPVAQDCFAKIGCQALCLRRTNTRLEQIPSVSAMPRANWWNRNWKWFAPVGCCSMVLLLVVFVASVALIVFSAVKS